MYRTQGSSEQGKAEVSRQPRLFSAEVVREQICATICFIYGYRGPFQWTPLSGLQTFVDLWDRKS
jgi:hypothetical protein